MKLDDLQYAPEHTLSAPTIVHRVQRLRVRRGSIRIGPLRIPPRGLLLSRFDLPDAEVGYFAETPETAIYEAMARREVLSLSLDHVGKSAILALSTTQPLLLLDLRPHAPAWPVLQSLRYGATQQLALEARNNGYSGIVYRSAQQYGADCYAIFGDKMRGIRQVSKELLVEPGSGGLHRSAAAAIHGSKIQFNP